MPMWLLNNYKEKLEYILEDTTIEIDNITYIDSSKEIPQNIFQDSQEELISHLQLTYLNLFKEQDVENIFQERMQIYCDQDNSYGQKLIQSVDKIRVCEVTKKKKKLIKYNRQFYRGFDVIISLEEDDTLPYGLLHSFGQMLKHFFKQYIPINSFIDTQVHIKNAF